MKESVFKGVATALITPFTKDYKVDFDALGKLIDFQLTSGTDALLILGTTAEASTLTDDEKQQLLTLLEKVSQDWLNRFRSESHHGHKHHGMSEHGHKHHHKGF